MPKPMDKGVETKTALKHLLNPLFEALKKESLSYCVCANQEQLPEFTLDNVDRTQNLFLIFLSAKI